MKQYNLTVSENQLRVIMISLESYFRTRLGQFRDLADDLVFCGFDHEPPHDDLWEQEFDLRLHRRIDCEDMMDRAFLIAQPRPIAAKGYYEKTPDMMSAIDIWHVFFKLEICLNLEISAL